MKNVILKISLGLLIMSSCTKLDETVYDTIILEETQFSKKDIPNIIAPAYITLREVYWGWNGLFDISEECADLIVTPGRENGWGDLYIDMHQHTWNPYIEHGANLWRSCYKGINNVNRALEFLDQMKQAGDNFDSYTNELKGLRAYYYYLLLDHFRNVPIVTLFKTPKGYLPEQNTGQQVYSFIESELNSVMSGLSSDNNVSTYGRFNKWAAKMVLAKLYLNSQVYTGVAKWDEANAQVNEIIKSGLFTKANNYADPFLAENSTSVEQIFSIPFDEVYASGSYYPYKTLHPDGYTTFNLAEAWGGSCGIPQFLNTYDPDDSRLKESWVSGLQLSYKGDTIKWNTADSINGELVSVIKPLVYTNNLSDIHRTLMDEGYRFVKYEIRMGLRGNQGNDVPLFRLTDAYMIQAECLLRNGKADSAALIVSEIRQRAFKTNPSKATLSGSDLMEDSNYDYGAYVYNKKSGSAIITKSANDNIPIQYGRFLDELAWEFVGEHHRRQDLIRFGVFTSRSWYCHKPNGDFRIIFPIPQEQMDTNSKLIQNSGYTD